jgi:dihydrofolate reductase
MVISYNVVSEDGYIADKNWDESFIPDSTWGEFIKLINDNDVIVLGRKSYDAMYRDYSPQIVEEFEETTTKKVIVSRDPSLQLKSGYIKAGSPEEALRHGNKVLFSGGPSLNAVFLDRGLIDKFVRLIIPVKLGEGIKPFPQEPKLMVTSTQPLEDGTILETYSRG